MSLVHYFQNRQPVRRMVRQWRERHQHPFNFWIHLLGIPLSLGGVVLFFVLPWDQWYWSVAAFLGGYFLQWVGHLVEGNDLGEWASIKYLLGLPYVALSPRFQKNGEPVTSAPAEVGG